MSEDFVPVVERHSKHRSGQNRRNRSFQFDRLFSAQFYLSAMDWTTTPVLLIENQNRRNPQEIPPV
jgi:hypothetical protein